MSNSKEYNKSQIFEPLQISIEHKNLVAYIEALKALDEVLYEYDGEIRLNDEQLSVMQKHYGFTYISHRGIATHIKSVESALQNNNVREVNETQNKVWELFFTPDNLFLLTGIGDDWRDVHGLLLFLLNTKELKLSASDRCTLSAVCTSDYISLMRTLMDAQRYYDSFVLSLPFHKVRFLSKLVGIPFEDWLEGVGLRDCTFVTEMAYTHIKYEPDIEGNVRAFNKLRDILLARITTYDCPTDVFKIYRMINNLIDNPKNIEYRELYDKR